VVASRALFGSCRYIIEEMLPRFGVNSVLVDGRDLDQWKKALVPGTRCVFIETPANPTLEIIDIRAVADLAHAVGARLIVDNVFATPLLQQPLTLGADIVVYSATKHIDGQGRALGGAVLGTRDFIDGPVKNLMRHTGPSLSPFNAWLMTKGLETLDLRVRRMADSCLTVARTLEGWQHAGRGLTRVVHPFLESHPQHELALRQMDGGGGTVVTFEVEGGKDAAFALMNALTLVDISNNLGDAKSLTTHPGTTTHRRLEPEARAAVGITDGTIRVSVGLEDVRDLVADLDNALDQAAAVRG